MRIEVNIGTSTLTLTEEDARTAYEELRKIFQEPSMVQEYDAIADRLTSLWEKRIETATPSAVEQPIPDSFTD